MIYCNEYDKNAAHWLRSLPFKTQVDETSIVDVKDQDLNGYKQCHFFAGIGGWLQALKLAGWPAEREVWTGSCPCQPFSQAGKGLGEDDPRHLWPHFRRLIDKHRPPTIFGEQVASKAGREWLARVRADLEALGYVVGAADLCAAGSGPKAEGWFVSESGDVEQRTYISGSPHIRQRLFWVAHSKLHGHNRASERRSTCKGENKGRVLESQRCGPQARLGGSNCDSVNQIGQVSSGLRTDTSRRVSCGVGDTRCEGLEKRSSECGVQCNARCTLARQTAELPSRGPGFWGDVEYVECRDGKTRPIKPGVAPLAYGVPGRVAQIRGLGNAIVPQVAATFIESYLEVTDARV